VGIQICMSRRKQRAVVAHMKSALRVESSLVIRMTRPTAWKADKESTPNGVSAGLTTACPGAAWDNHRRLPGTRL